jgi:hypothetical protein
MVYALRDSAGRKIQVGIMLRIGRDPGNQIVLQDPLVAPFHATLADTNGSLYLRDEHTQTGTFVNQIRIEGEVALRPGDIVAFGSPAGAVYVVEQVPEEVFGQASPPPKKGKGPGCLSLWPLAVYLILCAGCLAVFAGLVYVYKADKDTQKKALALVGIGPATIEVENLNDTRVYLFMTQKLDRQKDDETDPDLLWEVNSYGSNMRSDQPSGPYRIDFGSTSGDTDLGTCIFNIKSGETYHFVILPGYVLIDRTEYPELINRDPDTIDEFNVANSSLCHYSEQ